MNKTYCFFFTRSTEPNEPALLFSTLRRHLPRACPTAFSDNDLPHFPFHETSLTRFIDLWWRGILFWWSGKRYGDEGDPAYGSAFLGTVHVDTQIVHIFETGLGTEQGSRELLLDLSEQLRADYAFVHTLPDSASTRPIDKMFGGTTAKSLRRQLPGIPWAACYGQPYLDLFGKGKLMSLPIHETREVGADLVYCQLTDHLLDTVENTALIDERRMVVYEILGREPFFDPQCPDRQGLAPGFKKPVVLRPRRM